VNNETPKDVNEMESNFLHHTTTGLRQIKEIFSITTHEGFSSLFQLDALLTFTKACRVQFYIENNQQEICMLLQIWYQVTQKYHCNIPILFNNVKTFTFKLSICLLQHKQLWQKLISPRLRECSIISK